MTGTGNHKHKTGNGKHVYTLHSTCSSCSVAFLNSIEQQKKYFWFRKTPTHCIYDCLVSQSIFFFWSCKTVIYSFLLASVVELRLSMRKPLWDSQRKKKRYHCYRQNNQMFNSKTKSGNFSGTGIWPKIKLGNGIWAKFGLGKGIYTPPFRTLFPISQNSKIACQKERVFPCGRKTCNLIGRLENLAWRRRSKC